MIYCLHHEQPLLGSSDACAAQVLVKDEDGSLRLLVEAGWQCNGPHFARAVRFDGTISQVRLDEAALSYDELALLARRLDTATGEEAEEIEGWLRDRFGVVGEYDHDEARRYLSPEVWARVLAGREQSRLLDENEGGKAA